jgi:hypothetical protein
VQNSDYLRVVLWGVCGMAKQNRRAPILGGIKLMPKALRASGCRCEWPSILDWFALVSKNRAMYHESEEEPHA